MYLSTQDLAAELGIPEGTIRYWRHCGTGPKSFKIGRRVKYRREDVDAWLASQYEATAVGESA